MQQQLGNALDFCSVFETEGIEEKIKATFI